MPPPSSTQLKDRVAQLVQSLQFTWFVGHVLVLLGTFFYALSYITFHASPKPYKIAYLGAIVSYGVVIYKTHGMPKLDPAYRQRLVVDENVQYFILALYWFFSKPVEVTLIPFATFSLFHALGYIRSNIIPTVFPTPRVPAGTNAPATWQAKTQQRIKAWTDKNYSTAMRFVATVEINVIMPRLILGLLRLQLVQIFLYAQFLRFRFHLSTYSRQAFIELGANLDRLLLPPTAHPLIPPVIGRWYTTAKAMITRV